MRSRAAHRLRELGPARLDAGRVRGSLEALSEALAIELRDENEAGIEATLQVSAELAARLGVPEVRAWLSGADHDLADAVLPGQPDFSSVMRLRTTDHGRRELARKIAAYRSSPSARLRPDERLVELLLDPETLRYCRGRSWAFTFHSGLLLRDVGAFEESRRYLESSVETIESTRATIPDTALRQRFFSGKRVAYESLVEHYVGIATADRPQTDVRRAYAIANATKARGLLDLLDGVADPEMTIAPTARWQPTSSMKTRGETLQARLRLWVNRPVPRNDKPDPFAELHTFVPNQRDVRIVEYILAERVGFVFVAGPGGLEVRKIPGRAEMGARVRRHAELLRDPKADPAELRAVSERLYVDLIAPIQDLVVGAKRLIVAPDAAIEQVEFAALATPSRDRRPKWLIDEFAVSYVPSTAVARRIAARRTPVSKGSLLLGDPNLERSGLALASLSDAAADVAFDRLDARFRPLPGARREVDSIASYAPKPSRARTGAAATESLVLRPRVIPLELLHIAAHGVADGQSGLSFEQPAILLARADGAPRDGILTLEEILVLKPRARVVTLSGCETGVGWQSLGDGAFGLAGAFLFAGSEVVVASRWQVEDAATQRLMKSFYGNRKKGEAEALRRAQRALSKRLPPFYWASFRVFGDLH
jgi:CHAT domain-containing protein